MCVLVYARGGGGWSCCSHDNTKFIHFLSVGWTLTGAESILASGEDVLQLTTMELRIVHARIRDCLRSLEGGAQSHELCNAGVDFCVAPLSTLWRKCTPCAEVVCPGFFLDLCRVGRGFCILHSNPPRAEEHLQNGSGNGAAVFLASCVRLASSLVHLRSKEGQYSIGMSAGAVPEFEARRICGMYHLLDRKCSYHLGCGSVLGWGGGGFPLWHEGGNPKQWDSFLGHAQGVDCTCLRCLVFFLYFHLHFSGQTHMGGTTCMYHVMYFVMCVCMYFVMYFLSCDVCCDLCLL